MLYDARKGILKNFTEDGLKAAGQSAGKPGLPEFMKAKKEWKDKCNISYFVVSVGLEPIIEGSSIARADKLTKFFATKMYKLNEFWKGKRTGQYDGVSEIVTPFNKTGNAITIAKGGRANLNSMLQHFEYMFDYRNMIVLGDGTSDISQFAYARRKGSRIIGVYRHDSSEAYDNIRTNNLIQDRCNAKPLRIIGKILILWNHINQKISDNDKKKMQL